VAAYPVCDAQDFHARKSVMFKLLSNLHVSAKLAALNDDDDFHIAHPALRYDSLLMRWLLYVHDNVPPEDPAIVDIAEGVPQLPQAFLEAIREYVTFSYVCTYLARGYAACASGTASVGLFELLISHPCARNGPVEPQTWSACNVSACFAQAGRGM
jgi:hypothetical protein